MKKTVLAVMVVGLVVVMGAERAEAKGIPFLYHTGEEAFSTGPLPEPYKTMPELAGFEAGYICDIKGVMFSYFSVKNCKPAAIKGDSFMDDAELVAAIKANYPESAMQRGIWNKYGWMLLALLALVGAAIAVKEFFSGSSDDEPEPAA